MDTKPQKGTLITSKRRGRNRMVQELEARDGPLTKKTRAARSPRSSVKSLLT